MIYSVPIYYLAEPLQMGQKKTAGKEEIRDNWPLAGPVTRRNS